MSAPGNDEGARGLQGADGARDVEVGAHDLPLHCPVPGAPLWARHPRVFLDVAREGASRCPYCGTRYTYKGPKARGH